MRVTILGCGRVGAGVARELTARAVEVTVVDHDPAALDRLGAGFQGRKVVGSILDREVLETAGVPRADAVAVVTGSDEVNAVVALAARRLHRVPSVVARLYDPDVAAAHQRLGLRTLAPVTWGIQRIADLVTSAGLDPLVTLGAGQVELVDVRVPPLLDGRRVDELEVPGELAVVAVTHHGRTTLPSRTSVLREGDLAHVAVGVAARGRLETLLGHR
jgi:trk system potassium uptake protein TrkA